jgi:hypothetical protein
MKKILLLAVFSLGSLLCTSCTADEITETINNQTADDTGGQSSIPPPPPPDKGGGLKP